MPITTVDGIRKYTGSKVYVMYFNKATGKYEPRWYPFNQFTDQLQWHNRKLCQEQCDLLNNKEN